MTDWLLVGLLLIAIWYYGNLINKFEKVLDIFIEKEKKEKKK